MTTDPEPTTSTPSLRQLKINFETLELPADPPLDEMHLLFNKIRHENTNYDELIPKLPPHAGKKLFAKIAALTAMKFPQLRPAVVHQCKLKECLHLLMQYNLYETVSVQTTHKLPTKNSLLKLATRHVDKHPKMKELLECVKQGRLMKKRTGFVEYIRKELKDLYLLFVKYQKGELK